MDITRLINDLEASGAPWLATGTGAWDLDRPDPALVNFRTVADALGQEPRWGGLTGAAPFSVAQHCLLVAERVSAHAKPYALLHDAHEAYIKDLPSPVAGALKRYARGYALDLGILPHVAGDLIRHVLDGMKGAHDAAIFTAAGLQRNIPHRYAAEIKQADLDVLMLEAGQLLPEPQASLVCEIFRQRGAKPITRRRRITPMPWMDAADAWLSEFRILCPDAQRLRRAS